ncbi:hypothetical protein [Teredinibacter sp. KSP-S5-2]|uniref:hypothetical protein n=1 Tax=Teredinibacter sp. KSP-S5-2 TaxID=3034506 RepID=UPI002934CE97|nr:hypothetical protein [Teredinibacter sp. KSP-S5-2]WNO07977.1 hypothetical protein P5V12_13415 [Teredinibacter sp. KSP-S5-2]
MRILILFFVLIVISFSSSASVQESGKVSRIILEGNVVSVWVDGVDNTSECSGGDRWVLLESDTLFKEKYSALLMAFASGKDVVLLSTGSCPVMNANGIYYIYLKDI